MVKLSLAVGALSFLLLFTFCPQKDNQGKVTSSTVNGTNGNQSSSSNNLLETSYVPYRYKIRFAEQNYDFIDLPFEYKNGTFFFRFNDTYFSGVLELTVPLGLGLSHFSCRNEAECEGTIKLSFSIFDSKRVNYTYKALMMNGDTYQDAKHLDMLNTTLKGEAFFRIPSEQSVSEVSFLLLFQMKRSN